jgi:multidrug efflux system membrane fusion protein
MRRQSVFLVLLVAIVAAGYFGFRSYGDRLGLTKGQPQVSPNARVVRPAIPVVTVAAEQGAFPIRRRSIGLLESPAVVVIRSRIDSQMMEKHVSDGQLVRKGDLLFTLDDRELLATIARNEAQLAKDGAARDRANADLKRTEELLAKNVAARQQLDEKLADAKAAEATIAADKAQLDNDRVRLGFTKIMAPITGRIGTIRVTPGNLVSSSDALGLVTITQIRPIRVSFTLPERDLAALRAARRSKKPPTVRVYAAGDSQPLASGELDFVDSSVDTATGTIMAKATFANQDFSLWPGMYVDVEIDLDSRPDTISIPTVALQTSQKGPFVFVAKPDGTAEMRQVETGGLVENRTAIRSGLQPGERVVVEGQLRLANGARIRDTGREAAQPAAQPPSPRSEKSAAQKDATQKGAAQ